MLTDVPISASNNATGSSVKRHTDKCGHIKLKDSNLATAINRIHDAESDNLQCVTSANFVLNAFYHERILAQANKSFYCALISAVIGFALFAFTAFYLMNDPVKLALIGGVSTAITGVVSGTSFYLYRCTLRQFETFHTCLARTELLDCTLSTRPRVKSNLPI
jgi:hypothetical protein